MATRFVNALLLTLSLLALPSSAQGAPWSTRWTLYSKSEGQNFYVVRFTPSISQQGINGATAWLPSHAYALNSLVSNGGNTYQCTSAGTSASSVGPTTTGTVVDGTVSWLYLGAGTFPTARVASSVNSGVVWRFLGTQSGIYTNSNLTVTCAATSPFTPCSVPDVQIDMQLVTSAAANALLVRTRWVVDGKDINAQGIVRNYPYHIRLVPDVSAAALADGTINSANLDNGGNGSSGAAIDIVIQDPAIYAAVTIGSPIYVDFGACNSTCLSTL